MSSFSLLQRAGLSELEARTYLALLESGTSTAGVLARKLALQRSTVYYVLESLQKKGLAVFALRGKRRLFQATDPKILERYALETYESIKEIVPHLRVQKAPEQADAALVFTGYKGLKAAYDEMLAASKPGDEILVLGARGGEDVSRKTYRTFYKNFNRMRIATRVKQRVIMNAELQKTIGRYYAKLPKTRVRYLRQRTFVPIVIFPAAIAIVQWREEPSLFLLKGSLVVNSFKQYFEALWQIARP